LAAVSPDPRDRRSTYRSPDAVLAEARRIAADIRRRAERDAIAVRREAAEWASSTRREAERYRAQVVAEIELAAAAAERRADDAHRQLRRSDVQVPADAELRAMLVAPDMLVTPPRPPVQHARRVEIDEGEELIDLRPGHEPAAADARPAGTDDRTPAAPEPEPAEPRGTYIVGRGPDPVPAGVDLGVDDAVRRAVRRTFHRHFP
jgi:hypothetical protein